MQAFLFLTALAAASAVDCRKRTIPDFLCLLTAAAGLISFSPAQFFGVLAALPLLIAALTPAGSAWAAATSSSCS